jgi:hypothetical protein
MQGCRAQKSAAKEGVATDGQDGFGFVRQHRFKPHSGGYVALQRKRGMLAGTHPKSNPKVI